VRSALGWGPGNGRE